MYKEIEELKLKEFDEKFVGTSTGKIYNWNAKTLTGCSQVREFVKLLIKDVYEHAAQQERERISRQFLEGKRCPACGENMAKTQEEEEFLHHKYKDIEEDAKN